ncbi:MAG: hypothetical protein RLZZ241_1070, partial [Bacteroidota bacterium]
MRKIIPFLTGALVLLIASCKSEAKEKIETVKFKVTSPVYRDTAITKDYVSQIHSIRNIELRALEKGYLKAIYVDEGQFVKKGQQMFHIMPNIYEADLQKAQAEARVADIEYRNT